jgi:integrase
MPQTHNTSSKAQHSLPDLEPSRAAVLNSLGSVNSRRAYDYAIRKFLDWYCAEPRLGFNRSVVGLYRSFLEQKHYSASTINLRLGAVRRLASEAADSGPLSPDLAAGIQRVKGVKNLGARIGNWLTTEQACELLGAIDVATLKGKRNFALLAVLLGCGLRRAELIAMAVEDFDQRAGHWLLPDMLGKGGHIRTVPVPGWVKDAVANGYNPFFGGHEMSAAGDRCRFPFRLTVLFLSVSLNNTHPRWAICSTRLAGSNSGKSRTKLSRLLASPKSSRSKMLCAMWRLTQSH